MHIVEWLVLEQGLDPHTRYVRGNVFQISHDIVLVREGTASRALNCKLVFSLFHCSSFVCLSEGRESSRNDPTEIPRQLREQAPDARRVLYKREVSGMR